MKETSEGKQVSQQSMLDTSSVLKVRLDVEAVLERIRIFLTGNIQSVAYDKEGRPFIQTEKVTAPKANKQGIHFIMSYVENIINPQVVQGNLDFGQYQSYISECHDGLLYNIMNNLHNWGISEDDYEPIVDNIMNLVQLFITRLLDNKERDSYAQSLQVRETSSVQASKGLFK